MAGFPGAEFMKRLFFTCGCLIFLAVWGTGCGSNQGSPPETYDTVPTQKSTTYRSTVKLKAPPPPGKLPQQK
jgi:hypothetical protein